MRIIRVNRTLNCRHSSLCFIKSSKYLARSRNALICYHHSWQQHMPDHHWFLLSFFITQTSLQLIFAVYKCGSVISWLTDWPSKIIDICTPTARTILPVVAIIKSTFGLLMTSADLYSVWWWWICTPEHSTCNESNSSIAKAVWWTYRPSGLRCALSLETVPAVTKRVLSCFTGADNPLWHHQSMTQ